MKRILLTTLNSKFIHSSLALRYLRAYCADKPWQMDLREFTINDTLEFITGEIYREKADIIAFSTYIWNINETLTVARRLKQVMKEVTIILGGPEVTFESIPLMNDNDFIDYIVRGEGEAGFKELIEYLAEGKGRLEKIDGITYREKGGIRENPDRPLIEDLDSIPFPYSVEESFENRIVYYEASRGCPFECQYCLSSTFRGVRFFSIERVKRDLERLIDMRVPQVKFVDRTFNCNPGFAAQIFRFLLDKGGRTAFHFEISADLLNEELLQMLKAAPAGFFQFEIGVQTTNREVLKEIRRKSDLPRLFENVKRVKEGGNIHQHLDLIAGLPGEDMASFARSFDDVYGAGPDMLQLGFLKLIKGSGIRKKEKEYGYVYTTEPPYEVLSNKWISYPEMLRLKLIEEVLEYFYNSHRFDNIIRYAVQQYSKGPFGFYDRLAGYWEEKGLHRSRHSLKNMYALLYDYLTGHLGLPSLTVNEIMKLDFLLRERALVLPRPLKKLEFLHFKQRCYDFLNNTENLEKYLPGYRHLPSKNIYKMVHFEVFDPRGLKALDEYRDMEGRDKIVLLFDYMDRDKIRDRARVIEVDINE